MEAKFKSNLIKFLSLLMAVVLCITLVPSGNAFAADKNQKSEADIINSARKLNGTIPEEYKAVAESDNYILYLKEDTMAIILKEKQTGKVLYSAVQEWENDGKSNKTWNAYMQSGLVLTAIKDNNDTYQVDLVTDKNTKKYNYNNTGFEVQIYFTKYQFGLSVRVSLEGDTLTVTVPEESIKEEGGKNGYIGSVSLFPMLGHTYLDAEEGYMLLPDGNGALIHLTNKDGRYSSGFSQVVYGKDAGFTDSVVKSMIDEDHNSLQNPEQVIAPVFGMIHSGDRLGFLGIISEGDLRASVEVAPNGVMVDYNRCFAKFVLRRVFVQPLNNSNSGTVKSTEADRTHGNLTVKYLLASGENADYSGLARNYREYLIENGDLIKQDTAYNTRVDFLGSDREEFLMFTKAVTMTTVENVEEIFEDLKTAGVPTLLSVYKGWQKGGINSLPITDYKADSKLGGTKALTELIKTNADKNYNIYLYNNALYSNPKTSNTTFNTVKKVNKRKLEVETEGQVYEIMNVLIPSKLSLIFNKFLKAYTESGVNNLALAGASNNIFSYYTNQTYYNRYDSEKVFTEMIKAASDGANLVLEKPNAYLWKYTKAFLDMPLGKSDYMYEDEAVPFLSMVLKGYVPMYSDYVNFEANKKEFMLKMLEAGVYPSFYVTYKDSADLIYTNSSNLYSTKYTTYRDTIIEYDKEFREVAKLIGDAAIYSHNTVADKVILVTYDNGVKLYINYNDTDVTIDKVTVSALSSKVVK